ncbi:MAG: hypothetical protein LIO71_08410 [Ruminococcus sp.]|nr:hypothetical protein [Ruminococcus sp.]
MLTNDKRAHDLAVMLTMWQLEHIKSDKEHPVNVNLYALYRKNYTDVLNAFNRDPDFTETDITKTKSE